MNIDSSFMNDPIVSFVLYPELILELPQMPIVYLKNKHFFKSDTNMLKNLDGQLYLLISPHINASLANLTMTRENEKYTFAPYAYAKTEEHKEKYLKFGFQVFEDIQELKQAVYFEGCEEPGANLEFLP
jgi:hypothetical protein